MTLIVKVMIGIWAAVPLCAFFDLIGSGRVQSGTKCVALLVGCLTAILGCLALAPLLRDALLRLLQ